MFGFDALELSRAQFAMTAVFHILWPILTISLSLFLLIVEALWVRTSDPMYYRQARFWGKLLVLNFAVGVVSGIPMEFQFGTNWAPFSYSSGQFIGNILGFEGAMAFMLEAGFIGVMMFGFGDAFRKACIWPILQDRRHRYPCDPMLAFHHGHKMNNEQLPMLFAAQYSKMWGATTKRYAHCGHRHHADEKEYAGMSVVQHPTLAARDAHASRGGWISDRAANVVTYHKRFGKVRQTVVCSEMFEDAA